MKTKIIASAIICATAATVLAYPAINSGTSTGHILGTANPPPVVVPSDVIAPLHKPRIEVVFVLDTTGSMSGLIQAAKEKIWSIATTMASAQSAPEIKMGLVAYRDRGDAYVTRVVDLSSDLDSVYATLMDFQAQGGGDGPESVNQALYHAVNSISWSQDTGAYRAVFLVGDAPPHMDYQDDVKYPETLRVARERGIVVNTIQCGNDAGTTSQWEQIAQLTQGQFFQVEQAGSAVAIATPFDEKLARLSEELDATRLFYGNREEKAKQAKKELATRKLHADASVESRARRAAFNTSPSGSANLLGDRDLAADVLSGRVELSEIETENLPAPMQALAPREQEELLAATAKKRDELQRQIKALGKQRGDYLAKRVEEEGGARESLDYKVYSAVRDQAEAKGLVYEDGPEY
jgi:Mg-chelatase subunit ChlD